MVQKKNSRKTSQKRRKSTPRTYVFPYQGLEPIVQVRNGVPLVAGAQGQVAQPQLPADVATRTDVQQIQQMIQGMANMNDHAQILQAINNLPAPLNNQVLQAMQGDIQDRIQLTENIIMTKLNTIQGMMNRPVSQAGETGGQNVRQNIVELQNMEQDILNAINELRPLISRDIIQQADSLSNQLDQHLVALDGVKRDIQKTVVDETTLIRNQLLNDIEILQRNSVDSARLREILSANSQESNQELSTLVQQMIDRLGSSSRDEIQSLRTSIQEHQDIQQREQEVLKNLLEELKMDIRSQVDTILQSLSTIPRDQPTESPLLINSQQRIRDLETELREARDNLSNVQQTLNNQRRETQNLETQMREKQSLIDRLQETSGQIPDLQKTIEDMRAQEQRIRNQLDQDCLERLQTLRTQLNAQSETRLQETTDQLRNNLNDRIGDLEQELTTTRSTTQDLRTTLDQERDRIQSLEQEISAKQTIIESLQTSGSQSQALQEALDNLREEQKQQRETLMTTHQQELANLRDESDRERQSLITTHQQEQNQQRESLTSAHQQELSNLREESVRERQSIISRHQQELDSLRDEQNKQRQSLITTHQQELANLRDESVRERELLISTHQQELASLRSNMEEVVTARNSIQNQLDNANVRIQELEREVDKRQAIIEGLQTGSQDAETLRQTIESLRREEEERLKTLEDTLTKKRLNDMRILEARLNSEYDNQLKDLRTILETRVRDLEAQNEVSQQSLTKEAERVNLLQEELRKAQESNALLQTIGGEAEDLKRTVEALQEAEKNRLEELERSLNERHVEEINVLSEALNSEKAKAISEEKAKKAIQEMLQNQINNLESKLSTEQSRLQTLEQQNSENEQKAKELEDMLVEQESETEQLRKTFASQSSAMEKTIQDLRRQLEEERSKVEAGQVNNDSRIRELERLLSQTEEESKRQETILRENVMKIDEMEKDLLLIRGNLSQATTALEETLQELERLETVQSDNDTLLRTIRDQSSLLDRIQERISSILQEENQPFTENLEENVETLSKYVDRIKDMKSNITEVIPRYVIIKELENKLELIDTFEDQRVEFDADAPRMKARMYSYSAEIYELYEQIRRNIYDTELVHSVQSQVLTQLKKGIVQPAASTEDLIPMVLRSDDDGRVGVQILTDVFSPVVPTNMTSNNNVSIASALMRAFNYKDAISLTMEIIPDQGSRQALSRTLQTIILSTGSEIPNTSQRLYNIQEMYIIQMMLIDEIRSYLEKSKYYTKDFIYGLEARLIMVDSFIKAFLETKTATQQFRTVFKTKVSSREQTDKRMISYVRIRADDNLIDPRYSMLVNNPGHTKLQISHQPFVVSSLSMNDSEVPYFQHDMYGPFSKVFLPNESNREIAQNVTDMVNSLNSNKDVCTLALGPSGSGKTSTLLYFRGSDSSPIPTQGIIPLMLNQLDSKFAMAQVTAFEFAANYESKSTNDYWKKYSVFETPVIFNRGDYEWVSDGPVRMENFSYDTSRTVCEVPSPFAQLTRTRSNLGEVSIGSFVAKLTDTRLNCGTPNNPVSSRTHLFLFIKLMKNRTDNKGPTLIVADLAGREKTFDCKSEAVLENLALNKYYPTLNNLLNDPLGAAKESPIIDIQVGERFSPAGVITRLRKQESLFNVSDQELAKIPLKKLMQELSLPTFFDLVEKAGEKSISKGYVTEMTGKTGTEKEDVSNRFYSALRRLISRIIREGYMTQLLNRLESLEKQPLELRNLLEQVDDAIILVSIRTILEYFVSNKVQPGINLMQQPQRKRLERDVGGSENLSRALRLLPTYLNAILLIEYMNNVLRTAPVQVCGYRNIEGEFINRSLDELANLVLVASSFSEDGGPAVHPDCLPVSCTFAGLDCLLPKNVPKEMNRSAIADVLAEGMGKPSFDVMNTVFCTFVVINVSKSLSEGKLFRPIYDPAESMIRETVLAFGKMKRDMQYYLTNPAQGVGNATEILNQAYDLFSKAYTTEMELHAEYKKRLEYRGMDVTKMLSDGFKQNAYQDSIRHWDQMRRATNAILQTLSNKDLLKAGAQKILELDSVMRKFEQLSEVVRVKNQDTAIGVLMFADDLVKRGLQPQICTTVNEREEILSSTIGWTNIQLNI